MKKILKRGLSFFLALIMVVGILPVTAFAAVDSTGKPTNLKDKLILSIYTPEGSFPGEPATHGSSEYISFNSNFVKTSASGQFKSSAETELSTSILGQGVLVEGTGNSDTKVWGVFSADGLDQYFLEDASIIQASSELKIIKAIKGNAVNNMTDQQIRDKYEIIWYVIKMQHTPGKYFWNSSTTEWHIDGLIKEKQYFSVNYYGNGNTEGSAPDGTTKLRSDEDYTVLDKPANMKKKVNGVYVNFLGWSAKADGRDDELAFYTAGDVITAKDMRDKYSGKLSLYAMWDTTTQYTATVKTYLDNKLLDESDIHGGTRNLYLSTDKEHYYELTRYAEGEYSTKITGNGKFHLYHKDGDEYIPVGDRQLTIYNQDGTMEVYHYSLTYNLDGGDFKQDLPAEVYYYGNTITATAEIPTKEGYRFLGWETEDGKLIQPGEEAVASVTGPVVLKAKWEKTVNVTVNITIDHNGGDGFDQAPEKDYVTLTVASRADAQSPYLEVGDTLKLTDTKHDGFKYSTGENVTTYTGYTLSDMPGGAAEYTVVTSKSGYETEVSKPIQDADGNWTINVKMTYKPSNFDLNFTVEVDQSVPEQYVPQAAIVKVTFWNVEKGQWEIITQQAGGEPGVRVDINNREGSGSYPVWKYLSNTNTPYGNRIQVTAFVYPDGTIVPVSNTEIQDVAWSDNVYTATVRDVVGGQQYGDLYGAYYDQASDSQKGTLNAVITMDLHNVTFDAQGGKVNGADSQTVEKQYKVPSFKDYVPTRDGGYVFDGWYEDQACTIPATEGKDLTANVTLYAKWKEPLTISGTITVAGTYQQGDDTVSVHDIDRAEKVYVVLKEVRGDHYYEANSKEVGISYAKDNDGNGVGTYNFTGIPDDGKEYHIEVLMLNYDTTYDNEADEGKEFIAVDRDGDNKARVDAHLTFTPPSFNQPMSVYATPIGENFRPTNVLAQIIYRDVGDIHPYQVISQHTAGAKGVPIMLTDGTGSGSESIWKWHTDGTLYEYQMQVTEVGGEAFDIATAPYYISYTPPTYWDANTNAVSGEMKATLNPKNYMVLFNVDAGTDEVTGMEAFELDADTADTGATHSHATGHTWSYPTVIKDALPAREGYRFLGWQTSVTGVTADLDGNITISENVHERVVLTAQWEQITYNVTTTVDPNEGGTTSGDGTYNYGSAVTVTATPSEGYTFQCWMENGEVLSENAEYSFDIYADRNLEAVFSLNQHEVTTRVYPREAGTPVGAGTYDYGTEITVSVEEKYGYTFDGWYKDTAINEYVDRVTKDLAFNVTVTEDLQYVARFLVNTYEVTTEVDSNGGGTTSGDNTYKYKDHATVEAIAKAGYAFVGWYENDILVSENAQYTFEVETNRNLTAKFEAIEYTVTAVASPEDGGTVEGTASYHYGENATVNATAAKYYTFEGWYKGDECVSTSSNYSFNVTENVTLEARFTKDTYTITVIHFEGCDCAACENQYEYVYNGGEEATISVTPKAGFKFLGWFEGTGESSTVAWEDTTYKFEVESNRTLIAKFVPAKTITVIADPDNGGTAVITDAYHGENTSGSGLYETLTEITIKAVPNSGYYFIGWYDEAGKMFEANDSFTLNVTVDRTFTAKFAQVVTYECDFVYLFGYNDTQIGAEGPLLRGELAQMIYRLVKQNGGNVSGGRTFSDTAGQWFEKGIAFMDAKGAIDDTQQKANPYASVTRGETYKMICLGLGFTTDSNLSYSKYAELLRNWEILENENAVTGKIQRHEFCALFNRILGRADYPLEDAQGREITAADYGYTDLDSTAPYYKTMMIATSTFTNGKIDIAARQQRNVLDEYGG